MMQIFHLIDSGGFFGAERVLLTLANEQRKHGYNVVIVSYGGVNCGKKSIELECVKHNLNVMAWRGSALEKLNQLVFENDKAIFHSHGYKFNIFLAILRLRYKARVFVATVHGYTNAPNFSKLSLYYFLNKLALKTLKGVAFVSNKAAQDSNIQLREKNVVIFNGINDQELNKRVDLFEEPMLGKEYIVGVGRISAEKAFDDLILSFKSVAEFKKELLLLIVGDGAELPALKRLAAGEERIHFVGHKENPLPYIENARLLVISSHSEGLPIVLLEAMRGGIDIVSSRVGAIPLVIEDDVAGLLFEAGNVKQLTNTIIRALNYRKGALGSVARESFLEKFTAEKMFQCYHSWYLSLTR
jgi:glycosyltransferase involved in cell wall biosynthesis